MPLDDPTTLSIIERIGRIERLLDTLVERIAGIERAREVQIGELARRLDELNHAHQQAIIDRNEFVKLAAYQPFHDSVMETLAQHRGRDLVVVGIASIFITLCTSLAVRYLLAR